MVKVSRKYSRNATAVSIKRVLQLPKRIHFQMHNMKYPLCERLSP